MKTAKIIIGKNVPLEPIKAQYKHPVVKVLGTPGQFYDYLTPETDVVVLIGFKGDADFEGFYERIIQTLYIFVDGESVDLHPDFILTTPQQVPPYMLCRESFIEKFEVEYNIPYPTIFEAFETEWPNPMIDERQEQLLEICREIIQKEKEYQFNTYLLEIMRSGYFVQQHQPEFIFIEFEPRTIQSLSFQEIDNRLSDFGFSPISLKKNRRAYQKEVQP